MELFEIERVICIKMDLALNNLTMADMSKNPTNQPTKTNFNETLGEKARWKQYNAFGFGVK